MPKMPPSTSSGEAKTTLPTNASAASLAWSSRRPDSMRPRSWAAATRSFVSRISVRASSDSAPPNPSRSSNRSSTPIRSARGASTGSSGGTPPSDGSVTPSGPPVGRSSGMLYR